MSERTLWTGVNADVPVTTEIRVEQYVECGGRPGWHPRWEFDSIEEARSKVAQYDGSVTLRIVSRQVGPWTSVPVKP